jgi:hypothetical protein
MAAGSLLLLIIPIVTALAGYGYGWLRDKGWLLGGQAVPRNILEVTVRHPGKNVVRLETNSIAGLNALKVEVDRLLEQEEAEARPGQPRRADPGQKGKKFKLAAAPRSPRRRPRSSLAWAILTLATSLVLLLALAAAALLAVYTGR